MAADDVLLGFVADTKAALEQVLAMVRGMTAGLLSLGEQHPEVVINISNAAESLRTLLADLEVVRRGELDLAGQPLTISTEQVQERLDAVLGMLRGLNEEWLRLPDVAATASAGVAGAADSIAEAERAAAESAASLRAELAATAREATAAGEVEGESQGPLIEAAKAARGALSELYRSVTSGARSVVEEFALADRAIGAFEARLREASEAGATIGGSLPAELSRLQAGLLAVATEASRAGVAIEAEAEKERSAAAQIAEANRIVSLSIQEVLERSRLLESEGGRGWDTLRGPVDRARAAVQELVAVIDEARAAGSPIPPGADEQLSLFQARLERAELAALAAAEGVAGLRAAVRAEAEEERAAAAEVAEAQRASAAEVAGAQRIAALSIQEATSQTRLFRAEGGRDWPAVASAVSSARAAVDAYAAAVAHARAQGTPLAAGTEEQLALLQSRLANATVAAEKARDAIRNVGNEGERASSGGLSLLSRAFNRIAFSIELMLAYQAARKIKELGEAFVAAAERGQRLAIGLEAAAGGARQAAEAEAFLRAEALRLGFVVNEVEESYRKLTAAEHGANIPLAEQQALFSRTAEVMAELRAPQQQTNQLLQTFAEIIDRGAASTAQLRRRLSDELPTGLANLRAVTGLTEAELDKMTKGGQLGAQVLLSLITRVSEEMAGGFRGAIDSAAAADARLHDQMQASAAVAGEQYLPALANLREEFRLLLEGSTATAKSAGESLANLARGIEFIVQRQRMASAQMVLDRARMTGDVAAIAAAETQLKAASVTASDAAAEHAASLHLEALALSTSLPGLIERGEALQRVGRVSAETAREYVSQLDTQLNKAKSYDSFDRAFIQGQLDRLLQLRDAFSPLTVDMGAAFEQQLIAVRHFAAGFEDELHRTGQVTKDVADAIVKQVKAAATAFDLLPEATRKARAQEGLELAALLREFQQFTTGYEKEGEKQLKSAQHVADEEAKIQHRREQDLEKSIRRLAEMGSKPIDQGASADLKGAQGDLAKNQAELAALRAKPTSSAEDLARMDELQSKVFEQTAAVKKLQQQQRDQVSSGEAGNKALALSYEAVYGKVRDLITEDDKFKAELSGLGPDAQAAFQHVTQGLLDAAKAGTVTEADFRKWGGDVADIFTQAGVATQDFRQRLEANLNPLRTVAQMMDSLRNEAGQIAPGLTAAAGAMGQTGAAAGAATATLRPLTAAMKEQADQAAAVAAADRGAGLASADLAGKSPATVAAFEAEARAQRDLAAASSQTASASISLTRSSGEATSSLLAGGEAVRGDTDKQHENKDARIAVTDAMVAAEAQQGKSTEGTKLEVEQTEKGIAVITQVTTKRRDDTVAVRDATDKGKLLVTQVRDEQTATAALASDLPRLVSGHQQAGDAAEKAAGSEQKGAAALGQVASSATAAAPALDKVATSMEKIAKADPGVKLQAAADASQQLIDKGQPLAVELDKEEYYFDQLDAMVKRLGGDLRNLATDWDTVTRSMAAWRAEAILDIDICKQLTTCLQDQAAA